MYIKNDFASRCLLLFVNMCVYLCMCSLSLCLRLSVCLSLSFCVCVYVCVLCSIYDNHMALIFQLIKSRKHTKR